MEETAFHICPFSGEPPAQGVHWDIEPITNHVYDANDLTRYIYSAVPGEDLLNEDTITTYIRQHSTLVINVVLYSMGSQLHGYKHCY